MILLSLTGCGKKENNPTPQEPDTPVIPSEPIVHSCVFDGAWVYDSENHWKECECGEKSSLEEHMLELESMTDSDVPQLSYVCFCGYNIFSIR